MPWSLRGGDPAASRGRRVAGCARVVQILAPRCPACWSTPAPGYVYIRATRRRGRALGRPV